MIILYDKQVYNDFLRVETPCLTNGGVTCFVLDNPQHLFYLKINEVTC